MKAANLRKRRAQRGRPRDEDCERTPSGQKSRARRPAEDPRKGAWEARQRVYGVSADQASLEEAGSALGRLKLVGVISGPMYEAGNRYHTLQVNAVRALGGPRNTARGGSGGVSGDVISDDWVEWAVGVTSQFRAFSAALAQINAANTVELVVVHDVDPLPVMHPALRDGLGLLVHKFGLDRGA